jgi:cytochrome c peroxidase
MRRRYLIAICALITASLQSSATLSQSPAPVPISNGVEEPITPIPAPVVVDPLKVSLGERLFKDTRLSRDNSRSCSSCHDLGTNGASANRRDLGLDGRELPFNTLTVFNSTLNFRVGWEGKLRSVEADVESSLKSPQIMGTSLAEVTKRLDDDPEMRASFVAAYGHRPDAGSIVNAIASFERTLVTPDSRFDRWLAGDAAALSTEELDGYRLFKSLGCVSCHQGVNVGGNLFQRHGIFHPLASPDPAILRVPSLRNVATAPPYFHDGSAPTLDEAVRRMAFAQLNTKLAETQVKALVAYLNSLTGSYRGTPIGGAP